MRTALAGFVSWFALLIGFCVPWSVAVVAPEKGEELFLHVLGTIGWIGWFALPLSFIPALVIVWPTEILARRLRARGARASARAGAWVGVSGTYVYLIAVTNPALLLQAFACAFGAAVLAALLYSLIVRDIHHDHTTTNAA